MAKGAKKKRIVEAEGIAHIQATFNNTLVAISDLAGNIVAWGSAGKSGFSGRLISTILPPTRIVSFCDGRFIAPVPARPREGLCRCGCPKTGGAAIFRRLSIR